MAENGPTQTIDPQRWPSPREMAYLINQAMVGSGLASNASTLAMRSEYASKAGYQFGTDRDLYKVLGYKRQLDFEDYLAKYERQDIAARVVDAPPEDTWRDPPQLFDGEQDDTTFVKETEALFKRLRAWQHLENADALSGVGRYGVLLIGVSSGAEEERLENEVTEATTEDVIYLRAYDEGSVSIKAIEEDHANPRFGMPKLYEIDLGQDLGDTQSGIAGKKTVHWSRVIHIAERARRSLIYGTPRMKGVYNRLDDLEKVVGGSAEAIWKLIYKGIIFSLKEGFQAPTDKDEKDELTDSVQDYVNDLRRFLFTPGYDVQEMGGQVVDPSGMFDILVTLISAMTGIPKRILLGSERGELASSQDAANWAGRIDGRRAKFAEPVILEPLVDRLIQWGAVSPPKDTANGYRFEWQPLFTLTELEEAQLAKTYADAANVMAGGFGGSQTIPRGEWREKFTPLPKEPEDDEMDFDAVDTLPESPEAVPTGDNGQGDDEEVETVGGKE